MPLRYISIPYDRWTWVHYSFIFETHKQINFLQYLGHRSIIVKSFWNFLFQSSSLKTITFCSDSIVQWRKLWSPITSFWRFWAFWASTPCYWSFSLGLWVAIAITTLLHLSYKPSDFPTENSKTWNVEVIFRILFVSDTSQQYFL